MKDEKDYYLTTAITYTSGKPHIGNTYEIILADAIVVLKDKKGTMFDSKQEQMNMDKN